MEADERWVSRTCLAAGDEGTTMTVTQPATGHPSAERVDWTYLESRIADVTVTSGLVAHLALQRDAAESAACLRGLVQRDASIHNRK